MRPPPTRLAAAFALLTCALPVAAQDSVAWERFWPAAIGDTWTYELVVNQFCSVYAHSVTTVDVVGDTLVAGARVPLFRVHDRNLLVNNEEVYRVGRGIREGTTDTWFTTAGPQANDVARIWPVPQHPYTPPVPPFVFTEDVPRAPQTVTIGGLDATVDAVRRFYANNPSDSYVELRFAADVGLLSSVRRLASSGCATSHTAVKLTYARVGGVEYGTPFVAAEGSPDAAGALRLAVAPNPAGPTATLTLALPQSGSARVEVVDQLGRVVLVRDLGAQPAGATEHAFDTASLAPGVYVVRAVTESGVVTQRFTRAD